jgi:crotonobetainyl-CoA:carnitine CoA-transferase CaiB-like acyl-CoA transferase
VYETADGRYVSIGAVENRFWQNLCTLLGVPEYGPLQYDEDQREMILEFFRRTFKEKTLDEWVTVLGDEDVCWGKVQDLVEALNDSLFLGREMVGQIEDRNGQVITVLGIPIKLSDTPGSIRSAPVGFGESTQEILEELGYTQTDVEGFREKGVI